MKVFMALRIAVNNELLVLDQFLREDPIKNLSSDGSLAIISFHSLEDKIVAEHFKRWEKRKLGKQAFKKVITPSAEELEENSASASAKLRIFMKTMAE